MNDDSRRKSSRYVGKTRSRGLEKILFLVLSFAVNLGVLYGLMGKASALTLT